MHHRIAFMWTALTALLALSLTAGPAAALRSIGLAGGPNVRAEAPLTFNSPELPEGTRLQCNVTLLRTLSGSIPKRSGAVFGKVNGIAIDVGFLGEHCIKGETIRGAEIIPLKDRGQPAVHRELGSGILLWNLTGGRSELWDLIYDSFQGTLPGIRGFNFHVRETQFRLKLLIPSEIECLYRGDVYGLVDVEAGVARRGRAVLERTRLPREEGSSLLCPREGTFQGEFGISTNLTISLL